MNLVNKIVNNVIINYSDHSKRISNCLDCKYHMRYSNRDSGLDDDLVVECGIAHIKTMKCYSGIHHINKKVTDECTRKELRSKCNIPDWCPVLTGEFTKEAEEARLREIEEIITRHKLIVDPLTRKENCYG